MSDVGLIEGMGGKLTSTYHPEGDTYTLITDKFYFSISPLYKMVDVWNIGEYAKPGYHSIGRSWYETIIGLKSILETGHIYWNGKGI